jgi:hypothetical protein
MRLGRKAALAGALVLMGAIATGAMAQPRDRDRDRDRDRGDRDGGWTELGCQTVSFSTDRDSIRVGRREGRFSAIRLRSRGGDV